MVEAMIHFAFHRPPLRNLSVEKILNTAFSVQNYVESFPHIFSENSGALVATASNAKGEVKGMCAIDSEFWSEPTFLRGACIGSVAVAPEHQGQGLGRELLKWVLDQLSSAQLHDFIYLFSQPRSFYTDLGFVAAGNEGLYTFRPTNRRITLPAGIHLAKPREVSGLDEAARKQLWCALERGRKYGESHASWGKFEGLCTVSGLLVSWLEGSDGRMLAGAFVGKGIDFQGVMHTCFAESEAMAELFFNIFLQNYRELSKELLIAPGLWLNSIESFLVYSQSQVLCLVHGLQTPTERCVEWLATGKVYPRSLFSS
ncbi:MAG: Acetyltransferase domain [Pseudomonadota bacterium]|jgi:predicted N-acetyltransferase YhbS